MATTIDDVCELARSFEDAKAVVEKKDAELKFAKEHLRLLAEETIPGVMQELGLSDLTLDTGKKLTVKQDVYASIPADGKPAAHRWLDDNGFGGLIKVDVAASFGKGERGAAVSLYNNLLVDGYSASLSEGVHAQTMKAFLREQLGKGQGIPLDLFGARPVWIATIKNK
jgi:hypothetical protein